MQQKTQKKTLSTKRKKENNLEIRVYVGRGLSSEKRNYNLEYFFDVLCIDTTLPSLTLPLNKSRVNHCGAVQLENEANDSLLRHAMCPREQLLA